MSKHNTIPALSENHETPEHHRIEPEQLRDRHQLGHCYCTNCSAVCFHTHWYIDPEHVKRLQQDKDSKAVLCPGCTRVKEQLYEGEIVLTNSKCMDLMDEIGALMKHTEGACWYRNPTARIAVITKDEKSLCIKTTTRALAEKIGKQLHKAYKGHLEIKRVPEDRFVRVYWTD